ncbi:hypothetical protein YC2023_016988 [Brassica napus]
MLDADCDHGAKTQRTLSKDTAGSSQQAGPVDPSDDAYKKHRRQSCFSPKFVLNNLQDAEPSLPVTLDQANVEPLRNEMSTDVGAGGDSSPQKQDHVNEKSKLSLLAIQPLKHALSN